MQAQLGYDEIIQADLQESASKVRDQSEKIQMLERQLEEIGQEASQENDATNLIKDWIEKGDVQLD